MYQNWPFGHGHRKDFLTPRRILIKILSVNVDCQEPSIVEISVHALATKSAKPGLLTIRVVLPLFVHPGIDLCEYKQQLILTMQLIKSRRKAQ